MSHISNIIIFTDACERIHLLYLKERTSGHRKVIEASNMSNMVRAILVESHFDPGKDSAIVEGAIHISTG